MGGTKVSGVILAKTRESLRIRTGFGASASGHSPNQLRVINLAIRLGIRDVLEHPWSEPGPVCSPLRGGGEAPRINAPSRAAAHRQREGPIDQAGAARQNDPLQGAEQELRVGSAPR